MTSVNAAGMDIIGDGNPIGSSLGKDGTEKVGSHGSAAAQATVTGSEAVDLALAALHDKGIINYTGTALTISYGSPFVVFDPDIGEDQPAGNGEIVVGVGGGYDYSGTVRSTGQLDFYSNDDGSFSGTSDFTWSSGGDFAGTGFAGVTRMELNDGNLYVTGSLSARGVVTGAGGGANSGAAENVSVLGVSEVTLAPTAGNGFYNFTNKVDGQQLYIRLTGSEDATIDATASTSIYMNQPAESNAVVRWNATTSRWVGTKGVTLSI